LEGGRKGGNDGWRKGEVGGVAEAGGGGLEGEKFGRGNGAKVLKDQDFRLALVVREGWREGGREGGDMKKGAMEILKEPFLLQFSYALPLLPLFLLLPLLIFLFFSLVVALTAKFPPSTCSTGATKTRRRTKASPHELIRLRASKE